MVKATAACLHRVFWHRNHGEGNSRLPAPCLSGGKTMVDATVACLHRVFASGEATVKVHHISYSITTRTSFGHGGRSQFLKAAPLCKWLTLKPCPLIRRTPLAMSFAGSSLGESGLITPLNPASPWAMAVDHISQNQNLYSATVVGHTVSDPAEMHTRARTAYYANNKKILAANTPAKPRAQLQRYGDVRRGRYTTRSCVRPT